MYDIKDLYNASSVAEASALLLDHPGAVIIAGGSDVLIKMREGKLAGKSLVNIHGLDELRQITLLEDGTLRIGSLMSFSHIAENPLVLAHVPVLAEAVSLVGGPQVRNIGTIGGNTCNGVTSADSGATLVALEAEVELWGPEGTRILPLADFYVKAGKVDLRPGELQLAIRIRKEHYEGYFGHYVKYAMRSAMDIATLACSVNIRPSADQRSFADLRIAFGVAGPVPARAPIAESYGRGKAITQAVIAGVAAHVTEDLEPRDSWRASKAFRQHIMKVSTRRALEKCLELAGIRPEEE